MCEFIDFDIYFFFLFILDIHFFLIYLIDNLKTCLNARTLHYFFFFPLIIHKSCHCKHVVTAVRKPCVRRAVCALLWRPRQAAHGGELMLTKDNLDQHNETRRLCELCSSEAHLIFISLVFFTGIVAPPPFILPEVGRVSTHTTSCWSSFVLFRGWRISRVFCS